MSHSSFLVRKAVVRVDRDPDYVFRELHDPRTLMRCVPGGAVTRIIDARRFEARVVAGFGPFKVSYAGTANIERSDPGSRTAALNIAGGGSGLPPTRLRMSMAISPLAHGAELSMCFRMTVARDLVGTGLVDVIVGDLIDKTVERIKAQLEGRSIPGSHLPFESCRSGRNSSRKGSALSFF